MNFKQLYLKYFAQASVLNKLIIINVFVFALFPILKTFGFLFNVDLTAFFNWLTFPNDIFALLYKPWSIITYAFLHADFFHLLFNMLWLYFFGQIFLNIHTGRRFLNVYFLGAIFGALLFMLTYSLFPAFSNISRATLVGASAAVSAVMVAATVQSPNTPFRFMFIPITFKLWWITVGVLVLDVIRIPNGNAGGHIAHLGGALIGYLYLKQLQKGNDIGKPVEQFMDWAVSLTKPKEKVKLKTIHKSTKKKTSKPVAKSKVSPSQLNHQKEIDAILDKISKSGYESLSKGEKDFLFKVGKN